MRRKDREVLGLENLLFIVDRCKVCRLGLLDKDTPYIVPMNFGYALENDSLVLFFHSATEGRKIDILKKKNHVCFEMDCNHFLFPNDIACKTGFAFSSIIGYGDISFVAESEKKFRAMQHIMVHMTGKATTELPPDSLEKVCILKLEVKSITGKQR